MLTGLFSFQYLDQKLHESKKRKKKTSMAKSFSEVSGGIVLNAHYRLKFNIFSLKAECFMLSSFAIRADFAAGVFAAL